MHKPLLFILLLYTNLIAQDTSSMLWQITGNTLKKPSYIFGTYHTRNADINSLSNNVYFALKESHELYTEIMLTPKSERLILQYMKQTPIIPLNKRLSTQTLEYLTTYIKSNHPTLNLSKLKFFKTWAIALILTNELDKINATNMQFMDERLVSYAKQNHIKLQSLETPLEQLKHFDELNASQSELFLLDVIHQGTQSAYTLALESWYKNAQPHGFMHLQQQFNKNNPKEQKLDKQLLDGLLFKRNITFLTKMHNILQSKQEKTYFFAIGAGHLSDELGLVSQLKKCGYILKKLN